MPKIDIRPGDMFIRSDTGTVVEVVDLRHYLTVTVYDHGDGIRFRKSGKGESLTLLYSYFADCLNGKKVLIKPVMEDF